MEIVINIKETKDGCTANIKADFPLSFESVKDAAEWAEVCKSDIESLAKECDCPKCRAEKEAEIAKSEPEVKPEEPKPAWTPEVGMLIQSEQYGVWEITGIITGGTSLERVSDRLRGSLPNCELVKYRPIAELEGLDCGDYVYAFASSPMEWKIKSAPIKKGRGEDYFEIWQEEYTGKILVAFDGSPLFLGNGKQMFWRTADRAGRFGK